MKDWLPTFGRKWNSDVTIEGDGEQYRGKESTGARYRMVYNNPESGPEVEIRLYDSQSGYMEVVVGGSDGSCPGGDVRCALCDARVNGETENAEAYWERKNRLNCGCFDAESDEYKEVGEKVLQESGIDGVRIQ